MTKQEAMELEKEVDKLFSDRLETDCEVSMALTGALKVTTDKGTINIKVNSLTVTWIKWCGEYDDLQDCIERAVATIRKNRNKINLLMESYRGKTY